MNQCYILIVLITYYLIKLIVNRHILSSRLATLNPVSPFTRSSQLRRASSQLALSAPLLAMAGRFLLLVSLILLWCTVQLNCAYCALLCLFAFAVLSCPCWTFTLISVI